MKDPNTMTPIGKTKYIFSKNKTRKTFPGGRFNWFSDCLLGDIRTFLDGVENYIQNKDKLPDRGGGNLSIPILVGTALELTSAMYVGKTSYKDGNQYNATDNVKHFVGHFFPDNYRSFLSRQL